MVITSTGAAQAVTRAPGNLILLPSWSNKNGTTYLGCMWYSDLNCREKMVRIKSRKHNIFVFAPSWRFGVFLIFNFLIDLFSNRKTRSMLRNHLKTASPRMNVEVWETNIFSKLVLFGGCAESNRPFKIVNYKGFLWSCGIVVAQITGQESTKCHINVKYYSKFEIFYVINNWYCINHFKHQNFLKIKVIWGLTKVFFENTSHV